jgi:hypothetical protein
MSLDLYLHVDTGRGEEVQIVHSDLNATHNLNPMWTEIWGMTLGQLLTDLPSCAQSYPALNAGLKYMRTNPEIFKALNPDNGWGSYEGALAFLTRVTDLAYQHPLCTWGVSR